MAPRQTTPALSPLLAPQIQRSQYLADALAQLNARGETGFKTWGGMGATLLADAITQRKKNKADDELATATKAAQDKRTASLLEGLDKLGAGLGGGSPPAAPPVPMGVDPNGTPPIAPLPGKPNMGGGLGLSAEDRAALANMVWGEARGEPPEGQQAVASVALNRAKAMGVPVSQVVAQPHQFAGFDPNRKPDPASLAAVLSNIGPLADGTMQPTTSADHFYAPRGMPGGRAPSWAQGQPAQTIGNHQFLTLNDLGPQPKVQPAAMPMQPPAQPAPSPAMPPQAAPGPTQAAPGPSPAMSAPPAAMGAPAAPAASDVQQRQIAMVRSLLENPETQAEGIQLMQQLMQQQLKPNDFQFINTPNGVVRGDPRSGEAVEVYKSGSGPKRGLNPIWGKDANGQTVVMFPSETGELIQPKLPDGVAAVTPGVQTSDLGTTIQLRDSKTGAVIGSAPKDVAGEAAAKAGGQVAGETAATARINLPSIEDAAQRNLDLIDQVIKSPELKNRTGLKGALPAIPGTGGVAFDNMIDQIKGGNFLTAYNTLKGAGAITDIEGRKAEAAIARLDRRQSPEDFVQALHELQQVIMTGRERARQKANAAPVGAPQGAHPAPSADGWTDLGGGVRIRQKG